MRRLMAVLGLAVASLAIAPAPASAHPLGNFTTNTYAGLVVAPDGVHLDYVVDMAEIPAFQARQKLDTDGDGTIGAAENGAAAERMCSERSNDLVVVIAGRRTESRTVGHRLGFPAGAGGLPTLRLECELESSVAVKPGDTVGFEDQSFPGRIGWHEVTATGRVVSIHADVPAESESGRLTAYPGDLLRSPLNVRTARIEVGGTPATGASVSGSPGAQRASAPGSTVDRFSRSFVALVSRQRITAGFLLIAILAAMALGAVHAAAPGHGKAMIGAAVVGSKAGVRQAMALGATMAAAHTAGVVALGVAVASFGVATPERAYPWLTLAGGVVASLVGARLVRSWLRSRRPGAGTAYALDQDHDHDHGDGRRHRGTRDLVWLGLTGGLVPSPSALLVLLAALSLGRTALGVILVACFGLGMAATMTGLAVVIARADRALGCAGSSSRVARLAAASRPIGAFGVVAAGLLIAVRGAVSI